MVHTEAAVFRRFATELSADHHQQANDDALAFDNFLPNGVHDGDSFLAMKKAGERWKPFQPLEEERYIIGLESRR